MTDHSENSLNAVLTSLTRIVGPAVSQADPLAQQQLALTMAYLGFLRSRLPHLAARDRVELVHHRQIAAAVSEHMTGPEASRIAELTAEADKVLQSPTSTPGEQRDLGARIAAIVTDELRAARGDEAANLEHAVLEASRDRVALERSWYLPMGFDPHPETVEPLGEVLARATGQPA